MRMRWCRVAVTTFLRRWGIYLLVLAVLFAAGSVGAWSSIAGLAAWLVLPLFYAAAHPAWLLPVAGLQMLLNVGALWGLRSLLWSGAWADAERALPLRPRDLARSDAVVTALALTPLFTLHGLGAAALLAHDLPWLQGARLRAVVALALVAAGSMALGVGLLGRLRRAPGGRPAAARFAAAAGLSRPGGAMAGGQLVSWRQALLWRPLRRGPARRTGHALLWGTALLCAPALGLLLRPDAAPWWLAAFSLVSLLATSRINTLARLEFEPFWQACAMLPIAQQAPRRLRALGTLAPMAAGGLALLAALPIENARPPVLAAYAATCGLGNALVVLNLPGQPSSVASRWLFFLALGLALASEVMA